MGWWGGRSGGFVGGCFGSEGVRGGVCGKESGFMGE